MADKTLQGLHDGHRGRLRQKAKSGLAVLEEHELLEAVLFSAVPRRDTNEIAHVLLREFGCLESIFDAEWEDLVEIKGMTENAAVLLTLVGELYRRVSGGTSLKDAQVSSPDDCVDVLRRYVKKLDVEEALIICLTPKHTVKTVLRVARGTTDGVEVDKSRVIHMTQRVGCKSFILAHNHPSGNVKPSPADVFTYEENVREYERLGLHMLDEFILTDKCVYSAKMDRIIAANGQKTDIARFTKKQNEG